MRKIVLSLGVTLCVVLAAACASPTPAPTVQPTATLISNIVSLSGYRPVQTGDVIEGAKIGYQYILPSPERPVVVAFGEGMLELVSVKQQLQAGLIAYIQELVKEQRTLYAFDETDPNQTEPKSLTLAATRSEPVEIVIIPLDDQPHTWSVTETEQGETRAAYKLIRRKDGGLRFVDAYGLEAMNSAATLATLNGGGAGLVYSARLALLRLILSDARYQRGVDVMTSYPPTLNQYDPRILKIDPSLPGILQNTDWVLVSQPRPNPGKIAP